MIIKTKVNLKMFLNKKYGNLFKIEKDNFI